MYLQNSSLDLIVNKSMTIQKITKTKHLAAVAISAIFLVATIISVGSSASALQGNASLSQNSGVVIAQSGGELDDLGKDFESSKDDCKQEGGFSKLNKDNCGIIQIIVTITNFLAAAAAIVIVMMIIVGGIQYSASGADPSKVGAAKGKIINALIALLLLIFGFAFIQWIVPGGVV